MVREVRCHELCDGEWGAGGGAVLTDSLFSLCSACWTVVNCHLCFTIFVRMLPLDYLPLQGIAFLILAWSVPQSCLTLCDMECSLPISLSTEFLVFFLLSYETEACLLPSRMSFEVMVGKYLFLWDLTWVCIKWIFSWLHLWNLGMLKLIWIMRDDFFLLTNSISL